MASSRPAPYQVLPILRVVRRSREERQPSCDVPGCPIKRAIFRVEFYQDETYQWERVNQGGEPDEMNADMLRNVEAGWKRYGFVHCYEVKNVCHHCLCGRIEGLFHGEHGTDLANQVRDAPDGQRLLVYLLFREQGAPARFAFCKGTTIEECVREVKR